MKRPGLRAILWVAIAGAIASVGIAAAPLPWRFAGDSGLRPAQAPAAGPAAPAAPSLDPIRALAPFGRNPGAAAPSGLAGETSLGLTLEGVLISGNPATATAIISGPSAPAHVYRVGDAVEGSTTLEAVLPDRVTLRVDGNSETLAFPPPGTSPVPSDPDPVSTLQALIAGGNQDDPPSGEPAP